MKSKVGIVGWRGMVGSVLCEQMSKNNDWDSIESYLFSTSNASYPAPKYASHSILLDAYDLDSLAQMDVIVSCQGSEYTKKIYQNLRNSQWNGYWIDAASHLRMHQDSVIALDPVNSDIIEQAMSTNIKTFVGSNCTVSLMLMAIAPLLKNRWVEWVHSSTYQAASGAGSAYVKELLQQMNCISQSIGNSVLTVDREIRSVFESQDFPMKNFNHPLACSLLPWIDSEEENGQSREEKKGMEETNKILALKENPIQIDGTCVRVASVRCHAQALTIKLNKNIDIQDITSSIASGNEWVSIIPNTKEASLHCLTPAKVSGTLSVPVGRIRKLNFGEEYLSLFTVGDQLLWGAAEPLRRMLKICIS